tara:strand:- start:859 stop:1965 length:1107 start_codon:yes stop_codon:yes gene_type:complete
MATYRSIKYIVPTEAVEHTDSINALTDVDTNTTAPTDGQTLKWDGTNWVPGDIEESASGTQKAIFAFGSNEGTFMSDDTNTSVTFSSTGVFSSNSATAGTDRADLRASTYGGDKAIFAFGHAYYGNATGSGESMSNLVSNAGVIASDTTGVGTARYDLTSSEYGGDKAIFAFGRSGSGGPSSITHHNVSNLVSNTGVVATDTTGVGTARESLGGVRYGGDKGIFACGYTGSFFNTINLVSNAGVVASDSTGTGVAKGWNQGASYGGDKGIMFSGYNSSWAAINSHQLVSNAGVMSTDTTTTSNPAAKYMHSGSSYGLDKAVFYGGDDTVEFWVSDYNLVSNTGVIAATTTNTATEQIRHAGAGFSSTA